MDLSATDRHELVRALARNPGGVEVVCAGRSMEPTVRLGDRLKVIATDRPRIGDVVLFETADRRDLVLHRVVAALPGIPWFFHSGDAPSPEGPALAHRRQLLGRALLARRRPTARDGLGLLRRLVDAARRRFGR